MVIPGHSVAMPSRRTASSPRRSETSCSTPRTAMLDLARVDFDKGGGVVTVVTPDARSAVVLTVAPAAREALERTCERGEMHYRARSRGLWHKGQTSGSVQRGASLSLDCDGDSILARVDPAGPACHLGTPSCFADADPAG